MLPFHPPAGTSVHDYVTRLVPEAHRAQVPEDASPQEWTVSIRVPGTVNAHYRIRGNALEMREEEDKAHLAVVLDDAHVSHFLADFQGPRRYVPTFEPRGARVITDPRVLERLALVIGSLEAVVEDAEGGPVRLLVAAFGGKPGRFDEDDDRDVTLTLRASAFEGLLKGTLAPDALLSSGDVAVKGKRLVAMQFALALAPFFPLP